MANQRASSAVRVLLEVLHSPAMFPEVLQRLTWDGNPPELGDLFIVHKCNKTARCQLVTHQLGWECRLLVEQELTQSLVCRHQDDVFTTGETWRVAMKEKGQAVTRYSLWICSLELCAVPPVGAAIDVTRGV